MRLKAHGRSRTLEGSIDNLYFRKALNIKTNDNQARLTYGRIDSQGDIRKSYRYWSGNKYNEIQLKVTRELKKLKLTTMTRDY